MEIQKYPDHILRLQNVGGFRDAVIEYRIDKKCSIIHAYYQVSEVYFDYFGAYKYSDYDSYKVCVSRYHNKRRKLN